jgi:hypothetical protein
MRMGVWQIMEIDKSLQATAKAQKKSIDPPLVRSLPNNDFFDDRAQLGNSQSDHGDPITQPCRDCTEGMEW